MKRKSVNKDKHQHTLPESSALSYEQVLDLIIQKRSGGAINIKGVRFQLLCSVHTMLEHLASDSTNYVRLEGVEDIDVRCGDHQAYIQIKSSKNTIDASLIWDLKVLQHFYEVYLVNPNAQFVLLHNTGMAKGNLEVFGNSKNPAPAFKYWQEKFIEAGIDIETSQLDNFFKKISFKRTEDVEVLNDIKKILYSKYRINFNTEQQFIRALFYHALDWAKERAIVTCTEIVRVIQSVSDSFASFPVNPALQNNWIVPAVFDRNEEVSDREYFDGKGARPIDIAMGFPVKRSIWENTIVKEASTFDVIIIKSSSGQGKSTLAWQASQTMLSQGFTIYQLLYCTTINDSSAISDFLSSRIQIGEMPVVVIDGLSKVVSGWTVLAEKMNSYPVKFIITTREEDWVRFGSDVTNLKLNIVDIYLSQQEAGMLYNELQRRNKLHHTITAWQPAWEQVREKGLMIEFVYLLTQGQMLSKRLQYQIQQLHAEPASAIKLEILRLVAIADILNIRLSVKALTRYLPGKFRIEQDQNEIYRQLEREYYLNFERKHIQGLHPVRSQHLLHIVLSNMPPDESLLNLLSILEEDYISDYFAGVPIYFKGLDQAFFEEAARMMSKRKKKEMVDAIDGLMHFEAEKYWITNKEIYDRVSLIGGIDLFVYDSIPFNNLNTIDNIASILKDEEISDNILVLSNNLKLLSEYRVEESEAHIFANALARELENDQLKSQLEGIGSLIKWFKRLSIKFPSLIMLKDEDLLEILSQRNTSEASEVYNYFRILKPKEFKVFIDANKSSIIAYLKMKTNTLSIFEMGDEIHLAYIWDGQGKRANEESVSRIQTVFNFLPFYQKYCTSAIILPFPTEDIFKAVQQEAIKHMPPENIPDMFDVHLNRIWAKVLLNKYSYASSFDWQKETIALREQILILVKKVCYLFEAKIECHEKKINTLIKEIVLLSKTYFTNENRLRRYPFRDDGYFVESDIGKHENTINAWRASFRNFLSQMAGIFNPSTDRDRNLPLINLNDVVLKLQDMQAAYLSLATVSFNYFETLDLERNERTWLNRLHATANFYSNNSEVKEIVASKAISDWWLRTQQEEFRLINDIFQAFEEQSHFQFYLPNGIVQDGNLKTYTVGIGNFSVNDDEEFLLLAGGLCGLADTGIHFLTIVVVNEKKQATGAFRISDEFFLRIQKLMKGEYFEDENEWGKPLPLIPDEKLISVLNGVTLKPVTRDPINEAYFSMLINCWKLSEYRARLDKEDAIEMEWIGILQDEFASLIQNDAKVVYVSNGLDVSPDKDAVKNFVDGKNSMTKKQILAFMLSKLTQLGDDSQSSSR